MNPRFPAGPGRGRLGPMLYSRLLAAALISLSVVSTVAVAFWATLGGKWFLVGWVLGIVPGLLAGLSYLVVSRWLASGAEPEDDPD
jgi:hypothetical protein